MALVYIIADHVISGQGPYLYCLSIFVHVSFLSICQFKIKIYAYKMESIVWQLFTLFVICISGDVQDH